MAQLKLKQLDSVLTGSLVVSGSHIITGSLYVSASIFGDGLVLGEEAYSLGTNYVGLKTTFQTGSNDYMIISGKSDGSTYISAKDNSGVEIRGGGIDLEMQLLYLMIHLLNLVVVLLLY